MYLKDTHLNQRVQGKRMAACWIKPLYFNGLVNSYIAGMMITKKEIRQKMKPLRANLTASERHDAAIAVWLQLQHHASFCAADKIAAYMPMFGELNTTYILQTALKQGKQVYMPVIQEDSLSLAFYRYELSSKLTPNTWGVLEPPSERSELIAASDLDLVLVPLVAFDAHCHRLGMGKGFYDRTFAFRQQTSKPILMGLAYTFQEITEIPTEPHDISLDFVMTNHRVFQGQQNIS